MSDPIALCLAGSITAETALSRLLLAGESAEGIARRVREAERPGESWRRLSHLAAARAEDFPRLRAMLDTAAVDHAQEASPAAIAALFDRAVAVSPEASVAMYSLGDPAALAAATAELAAWLDTEHLIGPDSDIIDLGCGIGRVAALLAPRARTVLGLDISAGMIAEARTRCAGHANLRFAQTAGADLAMLPDGRFDLILAVDSFPYLHQSGLAERHVAEAARVLRDGGALAILNFSYRGDPEADRADAVSWSARHGFQLRHAGVTPFACWDGAAYVLVLTH